MASNKYRRHLDRDYRNPWQVAGKTLGAVTKAATIVAGVYAGAQGLKYIAGTADYQQALKFAGHMKTAGDLTSFLRGNIRGLYKTAANEGFLRTFTGKATESLQKNIIDELDPFFKGQGLTKYGMPKLGGEELMFVKELRKVHDAVPALKESADRMMRMKYVDARLKRLKGELPTRDASGKILRDGQFFEDFINTVQNETQTKAPVNRAIKSFQTSSDLHTVGFNIKDPIQRKEAITKSVDQFMEGLGTIKNKSDADMLRKTLEDSLAITASVKRGGKAATDNAALYEYWKQFRKDSVNRMALQKPNRNQEFGALVKEIKNTMRKAPEDFAWLQKMFKGLGYKPMTVGQAIKNGYMDDSITYREIMGNRGRHHVDVNVKIERRMQEAFNDTIADPLVFIKTHGRGKNAVVDARFIEQAARGTWGTLANNFHIPILGFRPLQLLPILRKTSMRETPLALFRAGYNTPAIQKAKGRLTQDYVMFGGSIFDSKGQVVRRNMTLESAVSGRYARSASYMSGEMGEGVTAEGFKGWVQRITDLGTQQQSNMFQNAFSRISKFKDPDYARNLLNDIQRGNMDTRLFFEGSDEPLHTAYRSFLQSIENQTQPLSNKVMAQLEPLLGATNADIQSAYARLQNATQDSDIIDALIDISTSSSRKGQRVNNIAEINYLINQFKLDNKVLDQRMKTIKVGYRAGSQYTRRDEAIKAAQSAILAAMNKPSTQSVGMYITDLVEKEALSIGERNEIYDLMLYGRMKGLSRDGKRIYIPDTKDTNLANRYIREFKDIVMGTGGDEIYYRRLDAVVRNDNPYLETYNTKTFKSTISGKYLPIAKSDAYHRTGRIARSMIENINNAWKSGQSIADNISDVFDTFDATSLQSIGLSII